jgi:ABC-type bacteriocin/lantibiotic exporter with double-glycine peptidase domain
MSQSPVTSLEPDNSHGGLNLVDFPQASIPGAISKSISMLNSGKKRLLYLVAGIQISLGLLDLVGIALIGLLAAVAVSGIGVNDLPTWVTNGFDQIGLGTLTISQLSVVLALSAVIILISKTVLSAILGRRIIRFLANRQADLSARLAREFLSQPLSFVQRWTTSEATYALGAGASAAMVVLLGSTITIAAEVFLFTIIGLTLLIYDPVLTAASGVFFGIIVLILHRTLGRWTARNAQIVTDTSIDTLTAVSEALVTYRETTVLNRRDLYIDRYESLVGRYAGASASNSFIMEIPKYVLEIALYFGVLLLGVVQFLTKDWAAAAATVALFLAAGSRLMPSLLRLQGAGISLRNASVMAQPTYYMFDVLQRSDSKIASKGAVRVTAEAIHAQVKAGFPGFDATVEVMDASLTYPGAATPALAQATFTVPAGTSIAFVGSTGAGKSTLTDVILGVLEPDSGSVTISGVTPRQAIDKWPGAISYVPQAVALVEGTVRDNVALGLPKNAVDDDLVWSALKRAHLAEFLLENREGLETKIGERGFKLSGGQRQRLGIARALYTQPKLLVLDEATSSLDSETERAIVETLQELEGEVTTITVAHRLATIRSVDQLIYLHNGRISAQGTFEEIRAKVPDFENQASLLGL